MKHDFSDSCIFNNPSTFEEGPSWLWSYGSWIYNYICNQYLSPLMWVRISISAWCTTLCDKVCQWLATVRWFSLSPPVSSTNKTDRHDITEILLKVALDTIKQTNKLILKKKNPFFLVLIIWQYYFRYKSKIFNHIDCRPAVDIRLHIETRIYIVGYKSLIEIMKYLPNSLGTPILYHRVMKLGFIYSYTNHVLVWLKYVACK
jgi:hypothetical protein